MMMVKSILLKATAVFPSPAAREPGVNTEVMLGPGWVTAGAVCGGHYHCQLQKRSLDDYITLYVYICPV